MIKMNPYTKPSSIPLTPVFQTMKLWKHSILQLSFPPLIFRRHPLNLKGFPRNQIVLSARSRQSAPDTSPHHISGIFVRARIQIAHIMYTWFRFWGGKLVFSSGQFFSCPAGRILPSVTGGGAGAGNSLASISSAFLPIEFSTLLVYGTVGNRSYGQLICWVFDQVHQRPEKRTAGKWIEKTASDDKWSSLEVTLHPWSTGGLASRGVAAGLYFTLPCHLRGGIAVVLQVA